MDWLITLLMLGAWLPVAFFWTGCPCCESCTVFSDGFGTDNLATDYDQRSGTWTVGSGTLSTTSASALLIANTAIPVSQTTAHASAAVLCATSSDAGRVVLAYSDDNNYWFAEVQAGATNGTLKLFQRAGGTNTQRGSTQTLTGYSGGDTATVELCIYNGRVTANATFGTAVASVGYTATVTVASTKGGLGTGSGSSSVTFDQFAISKHKFEDFTCPECFGCNNCTAISEQMQLTITGVADNTCNNCEAWNATWTLDYQPAPAVLCDDNLTETSACYWQYKDTTSGPVCTGAEAGFCVSVEARLGETYTSHAKFLLAGAGVTYNVAGFATYNHGGSQPNCSTFSSLSMSSSNVGVECTFLSSTVLLSSL